MSPASAKSKPNYTTLSETQLKWPHWVYQWICIKLLKYYFSVRYRLQITGKENQPKGFQSYIVAATHRSALDPPLVSVALDYQPVAYMAKLELFQTPLMRWYNQAMSSFAVNREKLEMSTIKTGLRVLKHGKWALGIFPEGTRVKEGEDVEAKRGVAYFAKSAKASVLPVGIAHYKPPRGRTRITVRIGELIPPGDDLDALTQKIHHTVLDLSAQALQDAQK